jgi:hypothetical protein
VEVLVKQAQVVGHTIRAYGDPGVGDKDGANGEGGEEVEEEEEYGDSEEEVEDEEVVGSGSERMAGGDEEGLVWLPLPTLQEQARVAWGGDWLCRHIDEVVKYLTSGRAQSSAQVVAGKGGLHLPPRRRDLRPNYKAVNGNGDRGERVRDWEYRLEGVVNVAQLLVAPSMRAHVSPSVSQWDW